MLYSLYVHSHTKCICVFSTRCYACSMTQHHPYRKAHAYFRLMHDETCKQSHTSSPCYQTSGWAAGHFRILSKDNALPLVAFSLTKTVDKNGKEEARQYTEFDLADKLRQRGWVLPAYTMAPDARWIPLLSACCCSIACACWILFLQVLHGYQAARDLACVVVLCKGPFLLSALHCSTAYQHPADLEKMS